MKEVTGNLWDSGADLIVITTNPVVAKHGGVVMGRGCAREARDRFPGIDKWFAEQIRLYGNHVQVIWSDPLIASFPVKHHWRQRADPELIRRSAAELSRLVCSPPMTRHGCLPAVVRSVALPRPGCGNGGLLWEDVRPLLADLLDDRFTAYSYGCYANPVPSKGPTCDRSDT